MIVAFGVTLTFILITVLILYINKNPPVGNPPTQRAGQPCTTGLLPCVPGATCLGDGYCHAADYSPCNLDSECYPGSVCAGGKICLSVPNTGDCIGCAPSPTSGCIGPTFQLDKTGTICLLAENQPCDHSEDCVSQLCTLDLTSSSLSGVCSPFAPLGAPCVTVCDNPYVCSNGFCQFPGITTGGPGADCTKSKCINSSCNNGVCSSGNNGITQPCGLTSDCQYGVCDRNVCVLNVWPTPGCEPGYTLIGQTCLPSTACTTSCSSGTCQSVAQILMYNPDFSLTRVGDVGMSINANSFFTGIITGLFAVNSSGVTNFISPSGIKSVPDPRTVSGTVLFNVVLSLTGNLYYFYKSSNVPGPVSYIIGSNGIPVTPTTNGVDGLSLVDVNSTVGNNVIFTDVEPGPSLHIYVGPGDFVEQVIQFPGVTNYEVITCLQPGPNYLVVVSMITDADGTYFSVDGYDTFIGAVNIFKLPVVSKVAPTFTSGSYSLYNGIDHVCIFYTLPSGVRQLMYTNTNMNVRNTAPTAVVTYLPGDFTNNSKCLLIRDKIYILTDRTCVL
jgi:hypothetical protein